jgi:hypothetical protein
LVRGVVHRNLRPILQSPWHTLTKTLEDLGGQIALVGQIWAGYGKNGSLAIDIAMSAFLTYFLLIIN